MGVASAAALRAGLLESLPPHTPVAVVQSASLPDERRMVCGLGDLVERLDAEGIATPPSSSSAMSRRRWCSWPRSCPSSQ